MQKWEYLAEEYIGEKRLEELGEQKWELAAVTCDSNGYPRFFYFKRPKS